MKVPGCGSMVRVTWIDSGASLHGEGEAWAQAAEYVERAEANDMVVVTVGFLIHDGDPFIIVALSHDTHHDAYVSAHQIWKPAIQTIEVLQP